MEKSIEDLEKEINEIYEDLKKLNEPMSYVKSYRTETDDNGNQKQIFNGIIIKTSDHSTKWMKFYGKITEKVWAWAEAKFKKYEVNNQDGFSYSIQLLNCLNETLCDYDETKLNDSNPSYIKFLTAKLSNSIKSEHANILKQENTHGMQTKRDATFEKVISYNKYYCPEKEIDSPEMVRVLKEKANWSDEKIKKIMNQIKEQTVLSLNQRFEDNEDSKTLEDFIEDKNQASPFTNTQNEEDRLALFSLIKKFFEAKNIKDSGILKNRAANCVYPFLNPILLRMSREKLEYFIDTSEFDFLKICKDAILNVYDNKALVKVEKDDFANALGIKVSKLSDRYDFEPVYEEYISSKDNKKHRRKIAENPGKISLYFQEKLKDLQDELQKYKEINPKKSDELQEKIELIKRFFNL